MEKFGNIFSLDTFMHAMFLEPEPKKMLYLLSCAYKIKKILSHLGPLKKTLKTVSRKMCTNAPDKHVNTRLAAHF